MMNLMFSVLNRLFRVLVDLLAIIAKKKGIIKDALVIINTY